MLRGRHGIPAIGSLVLYSEVTCPFVSIFVYTDLHSYGIIGMLVIIRLGDFWLLLPPSPDISPVPYLPLCSQSVSRINHGISTFALAWPLSPFGPHLTQICCTLLCSMNWCARCNWLKTPLFYWSDTGSRVRSERKGCRNIMQWVTLHPQAYGVYVPVAEQHEGS